MHPAIKIPFLLLNVVSSHITCSSPNPPPKDDEKKQYAKDKITDGGFLVQGNGATRRRDELKLIDLIEAILILSTFYPALSPFHHSQLRVTPEFVVGSLLVYVAAAIRIMCYSAMGRHFTFQLAILKDHKLIKNGPYSVVRHPGYTAMEIYFVGLSLCHFGRGSLFQEIVIPIRVLGPTLAAMGGGFLLSMAVLLVNRCPLEDAVLRKQFGVEWNEWARKTPYRLVPFVY